MSRPSKPYERFLVELRAVRKARGLTQGKLAEKIKLSRAQYTAIENGRSVVSYEHLHNLSVALGVKWVVGKTTCPSAARYVRP